MTSGPPPVFADSRLDLAAEWLLDGGLLVFPTETFYGLAADPRSPAAVDKVFRCKGRPASSLLPLIAGEWPQVELAAPEWRRNEVALALGERFWPGPLTMLLPAGRELAPGVVGAERKVAIRCTRHPLAGGLARLFGFPVTATSANRSGTPPSRDGASALAGLVSREGVALLEGGLTPGGLPSTIVDPTGGTLLVLREGAIAAAAIEELEPGARA